MYVNRSNGLRNYVEAGKNLMTTGRQKYAYFCVQQKSKIKHKTTTNYRKSSDRGWRKDTNDDPKLTAAVRQITPTFL